MSFARWRERELSRDQRFHSRPERERSRRSALDSRHTAFVSRREDVLVGHAAFVSRREDLLVGHAAFVSRREDLLVGHADFVSRRQEVGCRHESVDPRALSLARWRERLRSQHAGRKAAATLRHNHGVVLRRRVVGGGSPSPEGERLGGAPCRTRERTSRPGRSRASRSNPGSSSAESSKRRHALRSDHHEGGASLARRVPDAPGCQTFAGSEAALRAVAADAIDGWLRAHLASGDVVIGVRKRPRRAT